MISDSLTLRHQAQSLLIKERSDDTKNDDLDQQGVIVFNSLPWVRTDVVVSPEKSTKGSKQQCKGDYEYLLGKINCIFYQILILTHLIFFSATVENVPGLGASGYVDGTQDFHTVSNEKSAKGSYLQTKKGFAPRLTFLLDSLYHQRRILCS